MKQKGHLLGILFTVVVAFSARGGAKAVDMKFATSKDTFIKGEPIIITCTLSNLSTNVITLDLGYDRVQGFLFAVEGSQLLTNPAAYGGLSSPPKVELQPGATHREFLVLDEWSLPLKNGRIRLDLRPFDIITLKLAR